MIITRFRPEHLAALRLQPAQASFGQYMADLEYGAKLANGHAFTGLDGNVVVGCAGLVEMWDNRAMAWALLGSNAGRHFVQIHRAVKGFFDQAQWRRIEATVDCEFKAGQRWIKLLGFEHEGRLHCYTPDGKDHDLFARIRK